MSDERDGRLPWSMTFADLLGYIAPGGLFFLCTYAFEGAAKHLLIGPLRGQPVHLPLHTTTGLVVAAIQGNTWLTQTVVGLALLLMLYVTGHVIASFSSMLIERTFVFKGYGYPYETQLGLEGEIDQEAHRWREISRAFYRGFFLWFNIYALLRFGDAAIADTFVIPWRNLCRWAAHLVGLFLVISIVCKIVLGIVHSRARRQLDNAAPRLDFRTTWLGSAMVQLITTMLAKPYDAIARLLAGIMGTRRVFRGDFQERYAQLFARRFGLSPAAADTNNFWLSYAYVLQNSRTLSARLLNWQTLYGFSRNLATAFFGAFVYSWVWYRVHRHIFENRDAYGTRGLAVIPLIYYVLALTLLLRYYYLYRGYFTKFVFRAFVYLASRPARSTGSRLRVVGQPLNPREFTAS